MSTQRNHPCECGSGKKRKYCCGEEKSIVTAERGGLCGESRLLTGFGLTPLPKGTPVPEEWTVGYNKPGDFPPLPDFPLPDKIRITLVSDGPNREVVQDIILPLFLSPEELEAEIRRQIQ